MGALGDHARVYYYFIVQMVGGAGLSVLLATLLWGFKSHKHRNAILTSVVFSWWLSIFPCLCLLFFAGKVTGPQPSHGLCLASAVLSQSQSMMTSWASAFIVYCVWYQVYGTVHEKHTRSQAIVVLTTLPYLAFFVCSMIVLAIGRAHPSKVHRAIFYCVVDDDTFALVINILSAMGLLLALVLEVWIFIILKRERTKLIRRGMDMALVSRVCVFGVYILLGLCINIVRFVDWTSPIADLFAATCPLAVFIIFGTAPDILQTWHTIAGTSSVVAVRAPTPSLPTDRNTMLSPEMELESKPSRVASRLGSVRSGPMYPPGLDVVHTVDLMSVRRSEESVGRASITKSIVDVV